jgi:hypothetical protein
MLKCLIVGFIYYLPLMSLIDLAFARLPSHKHAHSHLDRLRQRFQMIGSRHMTDWVRLKLFFFFKFINLKNDEYLVLPLYSDIRL